MSSILGLSGESVRYSICTPALKEKNGLPGKTYVGIWGFRSVT